MADRDPAPDGGGNSFLEAANELSAVHFALILVAIFGCACFSACCAGLELDSHALNYFISAMMLPVPILLPHA